MKAYKGDSVVVKDLEHYHGLAANHLADSQTYELLKTDPWEEIVLRYHHYLNRCVDDKILDDYEHHCLKIPLDYQLPTTYFLPKIYKYPLKLRPIVASIKSITTNPFWFRYQILQLHMKQVRSYCNNTTYIVNIVKNIRLPHISYLASLHIISLYTNISFGMVIDVLIKILANHPRLVLYLDLVKFVVRNNIFQISGKIYYQLCGIAMQTTMEPALASMVVAHYEKEYLTKLH